MSTALQASEGLTGAGGAHSKAVHPLGWREASATSTNLLAMGRSRVGISTGCLSVLEIQGLTSFRANGPRTCTQMQWCLSWPRFRQRTSSHLLTGPQLEVSTLPHSREGELTPHVKRRTATAYGDIL